MTPYDAFQTYRMLARARASSWWPRERFRPWQEMQLKRLLQHAYEQVPLYRKLYDEAGFRPEQFRSLDDLERIPPLSKARLKAAPPEDIVARNANRATLSETHTSGSTGEPFRFMLGPHERRWQRVTAWRIMFEHGYRWTDRTFSIGTVKRPSFLVQKFGIAVKDFHYATEAPEDWARALAARPYQVITANVPELQALADAVDRLGLRMHPPRLIFTTGETLLPSTRALVARAIGTQPIDAYGLVETSDFAWNCERFDGYHISADSHILEVDASPGEPGPMTVTDLGKYTLPFIRYQTGDVGTMATAPCPCGRSLPRLQAIHGRTVDSVLLPDGRRMLWTAFIIAVDGIAGIRQWRVLQDKSGLIRFQVVLSGNGRDPRPEIERNLRQHIPEDAPLRIETIDEIVYEPGAKTKIVLSELAPAQGATVVAR
jgi:phenylacetate-CoA ligase